MKKRFTRRTCLFLSIAMVAITMQAQPLINEGFDNIANLPAAGWYAKNNSTTIGTTGWFQGNPTVFTSYAGAADSYIGVNFNSTTLINTISNWLITPKITIRNGDVLSFYTRKTDVGTDYPDRMQVRMSTNDTSTNVGNTNSSVGDFTTLLTEINPNQVAGGYPRQWTFYSITISGLSAPMTGRIAFRYYVTNGGPDASNSDYVGIDQVVYTPYVCPTITLLPPTAPSGMAGVAYNQPLQANGVLGASSYAVTAGALPAGVTVTGNSITGTPTQTGTFNFSVTVTDASGCTGTQAYGMTVACQPITLGPGTIPDATGGAAYSQTLNQTNAIGNVTYSITTGSLPAGVTLSSTGEISGTPSVVDTFPVDILVTDQNGCTGTIHYLFRVNCPTNGASLTLAPVCEGSAPVTLSGGTPSGGTYSGTGVTAGQFDPAAGTQSVTYSLTDGFGCPQSATTTLTVHPQPTVTFSALTTVCSNASAVTLSGGTPAGGTYSGTGVTGTTFTPSSGTQTITYTYTDGNGCSDTATQTQTVNTAPNVTLTPFTPVCIGAAPVTLSGGSPTGGTYSGTGVTAGVFAPSSGTQTITYSYTDGNSCTATATQSFTVNTCIGIEETTDEMLQCYPNPANAVLHIVVPQTTGNFTIRFTDVQGKTIWLDEQTNASGAYQKTIDVSNWAQGVYLLYIRNGNQIGYKRAVVNGY